MRIWSHPNGNCHKILSDDGALVEKFDTFDEAKDYLDCYDADKESEEFFIKTDGMYGSLCWTKGPPVIFFR